MKFSCTKYPRLKRLNHEVAMKMIYEIDTSRDVESWFGAIPY